MVDQKHKFLQKLSPKERKVYADLLMRIQNNELASLDCKPLKWHLWFFRVRKGKIRIIFLKADGWNIVQNINYRWSVY